MSKNQSIKGFFTQSVSNVKKQTETKSNDSIEVLKTPEKKDTSTKKANTETTAQKRARESVSPKSAKNKESKKVAKRIVDSDEEIIIDEKENRNAESDTKNRIESSESEDSPIKKTAKSKRRKLVVDSSSSSEAEIIEKEDKKTKITKKKDVKVKSSPEKKTKAKKTSPAKKKESSLDVENNKDSPVSKKVKPAVDGSPMELKLDSSSEEEASVATNKKRAEVKEAETKKKKITEVEDEIVVEIKEEEIIETKKEKVTETKEEVAVEVKEEKKPKQMANFFTKVKEAKKPLEKKETAIKSEKEVKNEVKEVKSEETNDSEKSSPKKSTMMTLITKKEEKQSEAYCKSTSKFFGGKVNEASNKESQISVSASNHNNQQNYLPNKEGYHPVDDACWSKGQAVPFKAIAQTLYAMEQTTKRLELLSIVCNYFRSVLTLSPKDLVPSMYLFTNKVAPDYEGLELGIGDTILFKALAEATGSTLAKLKVEFQNKGDIGLVAESNRCNQKLIFTPKKLTIDATMKKLREIASISGNSSGSKKTDVIKSLLVSCDSIEARYLMRALAGKLRNGLGENSILSALAHACTITPPVREDEKLIVDVFAKQRKAGKMDEIKEELEVSVKHVKHAYNQCPNYEKVVNGILEDGIKNLDKHCKLTPGVPLKPMLANPTKGVQEILKRFDGITFTCEYKYDGERAQIHILENGTLQVFSRNSENNTSKYPDLIASLKDILKLKNRTKAVKEDEEEDPNKKIVTSAILDAEVVAYDSEKKVILPFQVLSTRKRKDANVSEIKVQVCIFAFDLIMINGKSLIGEPFRKRREYLYDYFPYTEAKLMFAITMNSSDIEKIQEFLDLSIKDGCEGLMVKTLDTDAHYEISKRSYNWLKLKKDYLDGVGDTLDLVCIGGYLGTGKRTGVYGGYLLACYDQENEEYQTICKIGTGFKDEDLQNQFESLTKIKIDKPKSYYRVNDSLEQPDHWFEPEQVWEIKCADFSLSPVHTAAIGLVDPSRGMSMRFPRYLRLRDDKNAEQATSSQQVTDMYNSQQQMINVNEKKAKGGDASGEEEDY